jgi:hypothetical protein
VEAGSSFENAALQRQSQSRLQNQFIGARLQSQTLASTTGAAIIREKITKSSSKK